MKIRTVFISAITALAVFLTGCGLDKQRLEDSWEAGKAGMTYEEYTAARDGEEVTEEEIEEETEEAAEEKVETDDLSDVLYSEDFKQAFYKDYGSEDTSSDKKSDLIYIRGEITDLEEDQNCLTLAASDGEWAVDCGTGEAEAFKKTLKSLKGKEMRAFGTYDGWSKAWGKPVISIIKGAPDHACRLESMDGEIRVTWLDSKWEDKKADSDYSLGNLTWQGVSSWEIDDGDEEDPVKATISYAPLTGYVASMYVYFELLSDDFLKDEKNSGDVLDSVTKQYLEGTEILEQKKTKVAGLDAIRSRISFPMEDEGYTMDDVVYVVKDSDSYYALSFEEPYFIGACMTDYEKSFMDTVKYGDSAAAEEKTETKTGDDKKKADDNTGEKKETAKEEPEKTETKKTGVPTKKEIMSKVFTQHIDMTIISNGEVIPQTDDFTNATFSAAEMSGYDPATGSVLYWEDGIGYSITFSYNSKGKIVYSGTIACDDGEAVASGSTSGHEL